MSLSPGGPDLASLSSLDDPVRRRLYEVVTRQPAPVSRDEAASAAGIGRALAVYHLDKLVESGLLTASYSRPPGRSGPGPAAPPSCTPGRTGSSRSPCRRGVRAGRAAAGPGGRGRSERPQPFRAGRGGSPARHRAGQLVPAGRDRPCARSPGRVRTGRDGSADPAGIRALPWRRRLHQAAQLPLPPARGAAQGRGMRDEPGAGGGAGRRPGRGRLASGPGPEARSLLRRDRR